MLRRAILVAFPALGVLAVAQEGARYGKGGGTPRYDSATEATFKGTVEEVKEESYPGMNGKGVHVTLKTDDGLKEFRIGPADFLAKEQFTIEKGDELEIVGSKVKSKSGDAFVIPRTLKKGDKTLTLRDQNGKPLWSTPNKT